MLIDIISNSINKEVTWGKMIQNWLLSLGLEQQYAIPLKNLIVFLSIVVLAVLIDFISKKVILNVLKYLTRKTPVKWDDVLVEKKVFYRFAHLVPAIVIYYLTPYAISDYPGWIHFIQLMLRVVMVVIVMVGLGSLINAFNDIYNELELAKTRSIKGYLDVIKIIIFFIGGIIIISIFIGKSPVYLLTGLGAFAAILMLIFKDPLLGLVGGIQLSANDMVRPGDWITMPKYGADGIVKEIGLTTVKVQNGDKTIITIPVYQMVADGFQNWRGMYESGGRRFSRQILLDIHSIKPCNQHIITAIEQLPLWNTFKQEQKISNPENLPNSTLFRLYVETYLKSKKNIIQSMTVVVRYLQQTPSGLPLELIAFTKEQDWLAFEKVSADVFDELAIIASQFELEIFQFDTNILHRQ